MSNLSLFSITDLIFKADVDTIKLSSSSGNLTAPSLDISYLSSTFDTSPPPQQQHHYHHDIFTILLLLIHHGTTQKTSHHSTAATTTWKAGRMARDLAVSFGYDTGRASSTLPLPPLTFSNRDLQHHFHLKHHKCHQASPTSSIFDTLLDSTPSTF